MNGLRLPSQNRNNERKTGQEMKPGNLPLLQSQEWKALIDSASPGYRELASRLDSDDVSSLIDYLEGATIEEKVAAIALLQAAVQEDIPFSESNRKELIAKLKPLMANYPDQPGLRAFVLMSRLALPLAESFLMEDVDPSRIPASYFKFHLADLRRVKSSRAMDRIVEYSRQEGQQGEEAKRFLKTLGVIDQSEIDKLIANWRETKSLKSFNDLHSFYLPQQVGKPIGPLLELLGPWDRHSFNEYWYDSVEGPSLLLQKDELGNLRTARLK